MSLTRPSRRFPSLSRINQEFAFWWYLFPSLGRPKAYEQSYAFICLLKKILFAYNSTCASCLSIFYSKKCEGGKRVRGIYYVIYMYVCMKNEVKSFYARWTHNCNHYSGYIGNTLNYFIFVICFKCERFRENKWCEKYGIMIGSL